MDLRSPYPYWLLRHGIVNSYPSLATDIKTDIAIMGAGISGALVANQLCTDGNNVVIVDRRHAGMGSTAASTSLLQYEIDTPLRELIEKTGERNAVKSYLLCSHAIDELKKICDRLPIDGLFVERPSFQFASIKKDVGPLEKEFKLRKKAGLPVSWLDHEAIQKKFGFNAPAGVLSNVGAEADGYRITHGLLEKNIKRGLRVYDNSEIVAIRHFKRGIELIAGNKKTIRAKKLIIACGYESQQYIPKQIQKLRATFAIASEPFEEKKFWYKNSLIWETSMPYLYLRTTQDNRLLVGGKDIPFSNPTRRDRVLPAKAKALEQAFLKMFPNYQFKTDFKWAGTFASTKDGLPYIGSIPQRPHTYFALGFGGNGITFSVIAARIIAGLLAGRQSPDASLFSFDR